MRKSYFLIASFWCFQLAQGQGLDSAIKSTVEILRQQKVDTIVEVWIPDGDHFRDDTLAGIGVVAISEVRYLFYHLHNMVCSQKFVEHCNKDCSELIKAVSKVYQATEDTLFLWLDLNLNSVRMESLFPYISRMDYNGVATYIPLKVFHVPIYRMEFYINEEQFGKEVSTVDLEEKSFRQPENLNYKYNSHTKLSELFYLLTDDIKKIDPKYVF